MPARQPFLYPERLFSPEDAAPVRRWTCVRSRPRWEKKLARWFNSQGRPHFMPVLRREHTSHRKRRVTHLPLFPGYLFVEGDCRKADFTDAGAVVCVLRPTGPRESRQLHMDLWNLWKGLVSGSHLELAEKLDIGQWVEVASGPLRGVQGRFERWTGGHRLVLSVELLGAGVSLLVPDTWVVRPLA